MKHVAAVAVVVVSARAAFVAPTTRNLVDGSCALEFDPSLHSGVDMFPEKYRSRADYSLLWDVEYFGTYKVLRNKLRNETFALYQCGTPEPAIEADHFVAVPVRKIAVTSTTYLPYAEMLGERRSVAAYTSDVEQYVSSACLRRLYWEEGSLVQAYDPTTLEMTPSLLADVDVVIADEWSAPQTAEAATTYAMSDTHEDGVLKRAEYVEVVALFFNREAEAAAAVQQIAERYACVEDRVRTTTSPTKRVLWTSSHDGAYFIATCPDWYCEMVEAVGGRVLELEGGTAAGAVEREGWRYMSLAQLVTLAADADLLISAWPLSADVVDTLAATLPRKVPIYDGQGPLGPNDWWERRVAEPDALLRDLAAALWPETFAQDAMLFLRNVETSAPGTKVPLEDVAVACPDLDAPYAFLGKNHCVFFEEKRDKKKNVSVSAAAMSPWGLVASLAVVCVAAAAVAYLLSRCPSKEPEADPPETPKDGD